MTAVIEPKLRRRPDLVAMQNGLFAALSNPLSRAGIKNNMAETFSKLKDIEFADSCDLAETVMDEVEVKRDIRITEAKLHELFENLGLTSALHSGLANRANVIFSQICRYLPSHGKIIDIGCGDGQVTQLICDEVNENIEGFDVCAYGRLPNVKVPISLYDGKWIPRPNGCCSAVYMTNVLHHASLNGWLLSEAYRLLPDDGVCVILETIPSDDSAEELLRMFFIDWLYNRGFHAADIAVPGKYETGKGWIQRFQNAGFRLRAAAPGENPLYLGLDQDLIQDKHVLYVLEKIPSK